MHARRCVWPSARAQPHGAKPGASRQLRFVAYLHCEATCARRAHNGPPAAARRFAHAHEFSKEFNTRISAVTLHCSSIWCDVGAFQVASYIKQL